MSESATQPEIETEIVIVSPHLDDAVLSCWHLLESAADVGVVNVVSGSPPAGAPAAWRDPTAGAPGPIERMRERREEDRRSLALAGRTAVALDLLDAQYREDEPVSGLTERLRATLPPAALVYAPAA